jgi:peroxidase
MKTYNNDPSQMDGFTAGLAETAPADGMVGPLFACIIKQQFEKLRDGDRFFFSHRRSVANPHPQGLPDFAKRNIQGRSLGAILCDNLDGEVLKSKTVGRDVFRTATRKDLELDCKKLEKGSGLLDISRIFSEALSEERNRLMIKSQHEVEADEGFVTSPNFPNNYLNNLDTQTVLTADKGNVLELTLVTFELEKDLTGRCRFDQVEIFDGKGRLEILCGSLPGGKKFTSRDNRMTVKFHSDARFAHKGFKASWKEVTAGVTQPKAPGSDTRFDNGAESAESDESEESPENSYCGYPGYPKCN